jgi:hypothetical protein
MSTTQPDPTTAKLTEDTFSAIAITSSRTHVLAILVEQAVAHFGGGPLFVRSMSVVTCGSEDGQSVVILASAEIALAD